MYKILISSTLALLVTGCSDNSTVPTSKSNDFSQNSFSTNDKAHPEASLNVLKNYVKSDYVVLDIGSGSGIGPRQLLANGFKDVIVVEENQQMIKDAQAANPTGPGKVEYVIGDWSQGLSLPNNKFDLITAFSAFHCHANVNAVKEVYRLLKPEGYFFIIRGLEKNSDPVRIKTTQIIEEMTGKKIPVMNIDAIKMLKDQGFVIVQNTTVPVVEYFTKNEYMNYMKSYCSWDFAENSPKRAEIEQKIGQYLDSQKDKDGVIKIVMQAPVILAQKPASKN